MEEKIVCVAADKFCKQGYQATTLDEIAAVAVGFPAGIDSPEVRPYLL